MNYEHGTDNHAVTNIQSLTNMNVHYSECDWPNT